MAEPLAGLPVVDGVTHRVVTVAAQDGPLDLHVAEAGSGPPVLLLHGWPQHWYCWREVAARLAPAHRLIMPDLRGFGWSGAPGRGYHPEVFAADAAALLDALDLDQVPVLGHDWGGNTAFILGLRHPDRVRALAVCNAPAPWVRLSGRLVAEAWRTWYVLALAAPLVGPRLAGNERFLRFIASRGPDGADAPANAPVYAERLRDPRRARASSLLYRSYLREAADVLVARRYAPLRLRPPARLLFGREDPYIPLGYLDGVEEHGDDLAVELIPGCGHWTPEERPDLVAARAAELFAG
jgi:pimeloyl-ACP methyl ester carboxylesterase